MGMVLVLTFLHHLFVAQWAMFLIVITQCCIAAIAVHVWFKGAALIAFLKFPWYLYRKHWLQLNEHFKTPIAFGALSLVLVSTLIVCLPPFGIVDFAPTIWATIISGAHNNPPIRI